MNINLTKKEIRLIYGCVKAYVCSIRTDEELNNLRWKFNELRK